MKVSIITLFPKMLEGFFNESMMKKAQENKSVEIELINLRDFGIDKRGTVDDKSYGGGAGMILRVEPIYKALKKVKSTSQNLKVILTSPKGKVFNQKKAQEYAQLDHLIIVAGHYEGVDERVLNFVDEEVSIGDFVMTGGEIAAVAIADAVIRLLPKVLEKKGAKEIESFFEVNINQLLEIVGEDELLLSLKKKGRNKVKLLEYPQYTRPEEFKGLRVPSVLLSGNHQKIEKWRLKKAFEETKKKRKDLLI